MSIADDQTNLNPTGFDPDFASPRQWAEMYRAAGLQVVPCKDKRPDLSRWADLQETLVSDAAFARWYRTGREHGNMGIITGPCSGNVLVLDLDIQSHVAAAVWWESLVETEANGIEPETVEQITGGGGEQKLFRAPPGYRVPTNRTGIGVDIRGQAGFAVLPPTKHASGNEYAWKPLRGPWECRIADAPQWLLDAIEALVGEHGGHQGNGTRTASPESDLDAFGNVQDGREAKMTSVVYRHYLDAYRDRESDAPPPLSKQEAMIMAGYEDYERKVTTRIAGVDKRTGLEMEGRGLTAFRGKWRAVMRHWGSEKTKAEAAKPNPHKTEEPQPEPKVDPKTGEPLPLILTAKQFVDGFQPPVYLVDGILQRGYLWALTARTNHGKTAVALYIAQCVARGQDMHSRPVKGGTVLVLVGENPQDVRARLLVLAEAYGFDPTTVKMRFIDGVVDLAASLPAIKAETDKIDDLMLIIVDTAAAYFPGDDSNNNSQQGAYARLLRKLTALRGLPAVLVNCHPIKNAPRDNLLPLGGSAFLNEIDGNLTLWEEADKKVQLHWQGKFRGPEFEPLDFELRVAQSDKVHDEQGRLLPSVVAMPLARMALEASSSTLEADENLVLDALYDERNASQDRLATKCGFLIDGRPSRTKVHRILKTLADYKFVVKHRRGKYRLTAKGRAEIGHADDDE
jgi:Bifunctional DNA primase/polymerase, N-terminal/AAA domain